MQIELIEHTRTKDKVAELKRGIQLVELEDYLDLLGNAYYQGYEKLIIHMDSIHPDFFQLKTKLAGEVLQKFSNYRQKLAIVGSYDQFKSKSLKDFIMESNKLGQILFVNSMEEALQKL